MRAGFFMP